MITSIYHTLFGLELDGFFGLYRRHTDDASLLFYTTNMGRFTLPMCFYYLQMLGESKSALTEFMGRVDVIPFLGDNFPKIFAGIFAVMLLCKLLNIHNKLLRAIGVTDDLNYQTDQVQDTIMAGRKLIYDNGLTDVEFIYPE